jgi:hypothetical protein
MIIKNINWRMLWWSNGDPTVAAIRNREVGKAAGNVISSHHTQIQNG